MTSTPFDIVEVGDLRVTSLARSLTDAARRSSISDAVAMIDHALSAAEPSERWPRSERLTEAELRQELLRGTHIGRASAAKAISFGDGRSGSPGESLSRWLIHSLGFPTPQLQCGFSDRFGLIGYTDFYWPELRLIGEFDGRGKYLREEYTHGKTIAEIVMAEKRREDRLRALGSTVVRWGWSELQDGRGLRIKLEDAGLRAFPLVLRRNVQPQN